MGTNLARLDRFYVDDFFLTLGGSLLGTTFSNHSPLIVTLKKGGKQKAFRTPIPSSLYVDAVIRRDVLAIWNDIGVSQLMGYNRVAELQLPMLEVGFVVKQRRTDVN